MRREVPVTRRLPLSWAAALLLLACSQPASDGAGAGTPLPLSSGEPPTLPVVGGDSAPVCAYPMSAKIPGCTATLITPTILITARHCGPKAGMTVQFGEKPPFEFSVKAVKCVTATDSDAAYCVLPDDERLKKVPTVPVLHGCEYTRFMKVGAHLQGVGFGQTMGTGPARAKNEVEVPVARVRDPFIDVGDREHDLCFGDSGGGAYIHLVDGARDWGWRVIGTVTGTARGVNAPCGGTDYTTVLRHIKLIESTEKIDITPCTDASGAWAPGPDCHDFLTDIKTGGGLWPDCSPGPRTTVAIDSCAAGPAPASPADASTPPVAADASPPPPATPPPSTPPPPTTAPPRPDAAPPGGESISTPTPPPLKVADAGPPRAAPGGTVTGGCQLGGGSRSGTLLLLASLLILRRRKR
jgi:hypothetical protein